VALRRPMVNFRHQGAVMLHHTYTRFSPGT
jgi:hypothetical protein